MVPVRMISRLAVLGVLGVAVVGCAGAQEPEQAPAEPPGEMAADPGLMIPAGDPRAGRQAFIDLRCTYCHAVSGEEELLPLISANPGPELSAAQAAQSRERLADSIISPSHIVEPPQEEELSHMGDYSAAMTVRQLIDIVAYIESIREP